MSLKHYVALSGLFALLLAAPNLARADILGSTVTGVATLTTSSNNFFNAIYGYASTGYGNSAGSSHLVSNTAAGTAVTIGSETEFIINAGIITYTFNFTGDSLIFSNTTTNPESGVVFTFTDPAFIGFSLVGPQGANQTFSFEGDTLTLNVLEGNNTSSTTTYSYTSIAATPEPGSFVLLGTGVLGVAATMRRRIFNG